MICITVITLFLWLSFASFLCELTPLKFDATFSRVGDIMFTTLACMVCFLLTVVMAVTDMVDYRPRCVSEERYHELVTGLIRCVKIVHDIVVRFASGFMPGFDNPNILVCLFLDVLFCTQPSFMMASFSPTLCTHFDDGSELSPTFHFTYPCKPPEFYLNGYAVYFFTVSNS
jgi:hypothetical protein